MCKLVEKFLNFYRSHKQLKIGTFEGVFVIGLQLKRHNFGQWESFRGLVDIQRMCFLWVSLVGDVRFGRYKPTKITNFGDQRKTDSTSQFNVTRQVAARSTATWRYALALLEPIIAVSPQIHCNPSSFQSTQYSHYAVDRYKVFFSSSS